MEDNFSSQQSGYIKIRKFLINSAINFLNHPRLKVSTNDEKRKFLLNKGLTSDEIDLAFELSTSRSLNEANLRKELDSLANNGQQTLFSKTLYSIYKLLLWAGFFYGVQKLYQEKIQPLIYGDNEINRKPSAEEQICDQIKQLNEQIVELSRNIAIVHEFISTYCQLRDDTVSKMKNELISIKALLVNKNQFPSIPSVPKWQLNNNNTKPKSLEIINDDTNNNDN